MGFEWKKREEKRSVLIEAKDPTINICYTYVV
jgi:hypothetical protein